MRRTRFMRMAFPLVVLALSCQRNPTPIDQKIPRITLTVQEVAVTEAWLRLQVEDVPEGAVFQLLRNDSTTRHGPLTTDNTLFYDAGLLPNHSYRYRAFLLKDEKRRATSGERTVTTMDTTSHEFTWEMIEFPSPYGSGALYDAAIINENSIWAVGQIYADSAKPWLPYNAVHWDGQQWELKRIQFRYFCDQPATFPAPAKSVLAFGNNDVFISAGSQIAHWNGFNQDGLECIPVSVSKLWGNDKNNIYAVGALGKIAHYDGQGWQKLESGTRLTLLDIWGGLNDQIYAVGGDFAYGRGVVLKFNGSTWETIIEGYFPGAGFDSTQLFKTQLYGSLSSVWLDETGILYTGGTFMYQFAHGEWGFVEGIPDNDLNGPVFLRGYIMGIRGVAANDMVVAGERETLFHFNGATWHRIGSPYSYGSDTDWLQADIKGDQVVAVGWNATSAALIYLQR